MPASPTLTDAARRRQPPPRYSGDLARHHLASARRFRKNSIRRESPSRGPPQRSSPSTSAGFAAQSAIPADAHLAALDRDDGARLERFARLRSRDLRLDPVALVERPGERRPPAGAPRAGELQHAAALHRTAAATAARVLSGRISIGAGSAASSAASERPVDHMIFKLAGILFADRPAARRLARLVDRLAASGDQIMPVGQRLAGGAQPVGAGLGKPVEAVRDSCGRASRNRRRSFIRCL